ncbi:MAG: ProQ/FINO family protein [Pontibacterium sp.]
MVSDLSRIRAETDQLIDTLERMLSAEEARRGKQIEARKVNDAVNSKPKSKNRAANIAALQQLSEAYPKTFDRNNVRPLKIGIQDDLIADEKLAKNKIKRALASYVRSINYFRSQKEGAERVDINGEAAGLVTAEEAAHAKGKLKEINQKRREQKEEKEKQERMSNKLEALLTLNK